MKGDAQSKNQAQIIVHSGRHSSSKKRKRKREPSTSYSPGGYGLGKVRRTNGNKSMTLSFHRKSMISLSSGSNPSTPLGRNTALHALRVRSRTPFRLRRKSSKRLTANQLNKLYNTCTKLLRQNRISEKNSWDYNFIEHFHDMLFNSAKAWKSCSTSEMTKKKVLNFVTAGYLLATSTKFYSCRVDSLIKSTYKVLGGLQTTKIEKNQNNETNDMKKKKVIKKTLESNKILSMNQNDQLSKSDALFHKMGTLFDASGSKDLLLNFLNIDSAGKSILLDGEQRFLSSKVEESNDDPAIPSLLHKVEIIQSLILPTIGLFGTSPMQEGQKSEKSTRAQVSIAPTQTEDMHDFASVLNVDEVPDFGSYQTLHTSQYDQESTVNYPVPGGGFADPGGQLLSNILSDGVGVAEDVATMVSSNRSNLPDHVAESMWLLSQDPEKSASLLSSFVTGANWTGNPYSIRKQLNRMRRKKADALRAIKELKLKKKKSMTKESKDKFKLDFSVDNIHSLPSAVDGYIQMTEKELNSSLLSGIDPTSRFTLAGFPITSEWNLLPNDLFLKADMWKTLFISPDFNVLTPMDPQIVKQRGYNWILVKNGLDDVSRANDANLSFQDIPNTDDIDIGLDAGHDEVPADMLQTKEYDHGASNLKIVNFDHKYAAGRDVVDHSIIKKFALKPQPRAQDIMCLKKAIAKAIAVKKSDTFKQLVGGVLLGLSERSRSRLNVGSCLLVLLTIANRQCLSLERKQDDVFGDFLVLVESEKKRLMPEKLK